MIKASDVSFIADIVAINETYQRSLECWLDLTMRDTEEFNEVYYSQEFKDERARRKQAVEELREAIKNKQNWSLDKRTE